MKLNRVICDGILIGAVLLALAGCVTPPPEPAAEETQSRAQPERPPEPEPVVCPEPKEIPVPADTAVLALLEDLARYPGLGREEARRLQASLEEGLRNGGRDERIRLAVLSSLQKTPQGDQRALTLLEQVNRNKEAQPYQRWLAAVLLVQIQERQNVWQKLDALRDMERKLLEERMPGTTVKRSGKSTQGGGNAEGVVSAP